MQPIFKALGLSVGIVESEMDFEARRNAYAKDVTYGTAKEFGFDFLKDRLMQRELKEGRINLGATLMGEARSGDSKLLQRPYWFVLVDEADNVLIDEARTPLIISSPRRRNGESENKGRQRCFISRASWQVPWLKMCITSTTHKKGRPNSSVLAAVMYGHQCDLDWSTL